MKHDKNTHEVVVSIVAETTEATDIANKLNALIAPLKRGHCCNILI